MNTFLNVTTVPGKPKNVQLFLLSKISTHLLKDSDAAPKMATSLTPLSTFIRKTTAHFAFKKSSTVKLHNIRYMLSDDTLVLK